MIKLKRVGISINDDFKIIIKFRIDHQCTPIIKAFKASNGIVLLSYKFPDWYPSMRTLYTQGSHRSKNNRVIICTCDDWIDIYEAVKEYNMKEL